MIVSRPKALLATFAALLLAGCAATELPFVVYPLPPDTPRVQWLGTYASQDDFTKSGFQVFWEGVGGKPQLATFKSPFGIVADSRGLIYVADPLAGSLLVYDLEKKEVNNYSDRSYFSQPFGVAVDGADNLYVVDGKKKHVLVFNAERQFLSVIGGPADFKGPAFVKVDDVRDRVYVSDALGNKIVVFSREGKKLFEIGPKITETDSLYNPQGMAIDKDGNLFVAEMLRARISVLSPAGELLRSFGVRGDAAYEFEAPKDLAFDSDGNLWVADNRRTEIYTYTPAGELLLATGSGSRLNTGPLSFSSPTSISIDAQDRVLVTDRLNRRFMVWQYRSAAYAAAHPLAAEELAALEKMRQQREEQRMPSSSKP